MYSMCVTLYVHLVLETHLAHLALQTIPFFDVGQVFPLEMLGQIAGRVEFVEKVVYLWIIRWQR